MAHRSSELCVKNRHLLGFLKLYAASGKCVFPVKEGKLPIWGWKDHTISDCTEQDFIDQLVWAQDKGIAVTGLGMRCGKWSGNEFTFDFDHMDKCHEVRAFIIKHMNYDIFELTKIYSGKGLHLCCVTDKCLDIDGGDLATFIPEGEEALSAFVELKGNSHIIIKPPSDHVKSGNRYRFECEGQVEPVYLPSQKLFRIIELIKTLDEKPKPVPKKVKTKPMSFRLPPALSLDSKRGGEFIFTPQQVKTAYNDRYVIETLLARYGYIDRGNGMWDHPNSGKNGSEVSIQHDCSFHYSPSDPAHAAGWENGNAKGHDRFGLFCILEHNGDFNAAIAAAAKELGMDGKTKHIANDEEFDVEQFMISLEELTTESETV